MLSTLRILALVAAVGTLAACAQPRTYQEDAAMRGAAVGGATGAVIGGLAGRSAGSAVAGGILGAATGGLLGAAAAAPPPPPPPEVIVEPETCYARDRAGRMRPVPCD
jgi:hypothetical protein